MSLNHGCNRIIKGRFNFLPVNSDLQIEPKSFCDAQDQSKVSLWGHRHDKLAILPLPTSVSQCIISSIRRQNKGCKLIAVD